MSEVSNTMFTSLEASDTGLKKQHFLWTHNMPYRNIRTLEFPTSNKMFN